MSHRKWLFIVPVAGLLLFSLAQAQDAQRGGERRSDDQDRRGRGNFDPAQFRQRMMDNMKQELGAADDEWQVLAPKIEKVMNAQRETRGGFGFGGFTGRRPGERGGDRPRGDQPTSKVAQAQQDLRTTLDNKNASSEEITRKLNAFREARDRARTELQAAQKDLKEVVTPRQEAILVTSGMLD